MNLTSWFSYKDLLKVEVKDNNEKIVEIEKTILHGYHKSRDFLKKILNGKIMIRESLNGKLLNVDFLLKNYNKNYRLYVYEGYRPLYIQKQRFGEMLRQVSTVTFYADPVELYNIVHETVAVPTVAGHSTGGAVDVAIYNTKTMKIEDFGSQIYDYTNKNHRMSYNSLTTKQLSNRMILRECMTKSGFTPFNGEYWHFSYGDKEWAKYYNEKNAIYVTKDIDEINLYM